MISCPRCHGTGLIQTPQEIARQLRALRTRAGVSQVELARRLKITSAGISMVESGRRSVNSRWLHRYSAVLGHEER
jgi:transcriptional regulator with XRE-family HTH domain